MITYKITNEDKFDERVMDVVTDNLFEQYGGTFTGTIGIDTEDGEDPRITGQHGANDYEEEYGFVIVVEGDEDE